MPNLSRHPGDTVEDDLEIATRVMDTVQRQVSSYRDALQTLRNLRKELAERQGEDKTADASRRVISTPEEFADLLQERGVPQGFSRAMAAEDFQDASFAVETMTFTWDCCCTHCCLTCDMGSQVTGCSETFIL